MPTGNEPPILGIPQAVFDAISAMAYDSETQAFKDSRGTLYWLFVEQVSATESDRGRWFHATSGDGGSNPIALIPQQTYTVIHDGLYETSDGTISYDGRSYGIRLERNRNTSVQLAKVVVVT